ncbi:peptidoglycan-binding protein [Streptomyces sp. Tu 4128]|uniref:peptidoglycan-binding domain-containing protein n=1 Tax=Streptomyces sp. Tu 4128 TaxID=1120314 RepID=UPI0013CE689D|nr:peptidoglycan-binding protein [Streptomyces sp. Tu 4128]
MKFEQRVLWTVLPAGLSADGTQVEVSVFVTPRLGVPDPDPAPDAPEGQARGTLRSFPDFLAWPDKVKDATFEFGPGDGVSPSFSGPVRPSGPLPDTGLWTKLFGEDIPLDPYVFESMAEQGEGARTYSAKRVSDVTRTAYRLAATESPEQPPEMRPILQGMMNTRAPGLASEVSEMRRGLDELEDFHRAQSQSVPTLAGAEAPPAPAPKKLEPDFHQMLTSLGDHPALLRRLGLILDFLLPAERIPVSAGEHLMSVVPHWVPELGPNSQDLPPRTRYVFLPDRKLFVAAPRTFEADPLGSPALGLVALPEEDFSLEQADLDSAALKVAELARDPAESGGAASDPTTQAPETKGLAPVRTQGISLVRDGRAGVLAADFAQAAHTNDTAVAALEANRQAGDGQEAHRPDSPAMPDLCAEDLVRGHRMDVWDDTRARWYSLHARTVEYRSPGGDEPLLTASDEGFFQVNLASQPADAGSDALYIPERITTWEGWSLSAPRPGRVLGIGEGAPDEVVEPTNEARTRLPLEIDIGVQRGSLPLLRFGRGYRVRLRTVDLAGNGLTPGEADALVDQDGGGDWVLPGRGPLVFRRFESVPAPAVVPRLPLDEGASVSRMVVRSTPGSAPGPTGDAAPGAGTRTVVLANVQPGRTNDDVRLVQQALIDRNQAIPAGATGHFGAQTAEAYAAEQREQGFHGGDADGTPGCQSLTELGRKSGFTVDCDSTAGTPGTVGEAPRGTEPARTAEQYAAELNSSPLVTTGDHTPFSGVDERHLVAPKASLQCVERHGLLDGAIGSRDRAAREAGYELASRENGSLNDPAQPDVEVKTIDSPAADPEHPAATVRYKGEHIELPYLREPLATGVLLLDLPGMQEGEPFEIPWGGSAWHRPLSFRLRLAEGDAPPHFDESSRVLTVSLPKARVATIRVCSAMQFDEKLMGLASWCREQPARQLAPETAPEDRERAAQEDEEERERASTAMDRAAAGRHWMFTPAQELTLVHAVQRPLKQPVLDLKPSAHRPVEATAEHLDGVIRLDEASTDRIELVAKWTEVSDEGEEGRTERPMTMPVFDLLTARLPLNDEAGPEPATLRDGTLTFSTRTAEESARREPRKHDFGDTKHRRVHYHPVAGTRFGDYFPTRLAEHDASALTVEGTAVEHSVPSSARPTVPRPLYCVPTLSLATVEGPPGTIVRRRRGGGIRVFLQRPWFSSGDGELLGVVLGEATGAGTSVTDAPGVTLMGRDPIHRSADVVAPTVSTFTNAVRHAEGLTPVPTGPPTVTVLGFAPQFDATGNRWFCDLDLDTGDTCLPFMRLALVRFQPNSIPGVEISPVVVTDLVRTLPDRELRVTLDEVPTVSLTGPSYDPSDSPPPRITATVQRRRDAVADEDLAWVTLDDTTVTLTSIDAVSTRTPSYVGQVHLPPGTRRDRLRLLVMETDGIPPDAATPPTTPGPVVYCDTVPLGGDHRRPEDHDRRDHHRRDDGRPN